MKKNEITKSVSKMSAEEILETPARTLKNLLLYQRGIKDGKKAKKNKK